VDVSALATSAKQLADNHNVTVSNPTADPETGLATSDNQTNGSQETIILAKTGDATYQVPRLDVITHAFSTIEYEHHEIHGGKMYHAYYAVTTAATSGHKSGLYIKTPAAGGALCHVVVHFSASVAADAHILEAPTIDANVGTSHTNVIYNRYRDSVNESGVLSNAASPVANRFTTMAYDQFGGTWAEGTVLEAYALQTGTGPKAAGGESRGASEWILKAGTAYVFMLENTVATANNHLIHIDWYEHTNKSA